MVILTSLLFACGIYLLLHRQSAIVEPAARRSFQGKKEKEDIFTVLAKPLTKLVLPRVKLNPLKREALQNTLRTVGVTDSPEFFTAKNIGKLLFIGVGGFAICPLFGSFAPFIVIAFWGMAAYEYVRDSRYGDRKLKEKRTAIEMELPRFSSTISTSLEGGKSTDVLRILESYQKIAGDALKSELEMTIADIRTGNLQNALRNFENRIQSHKLSELIRGLLSVSYGDNQSVYFQIKENEFRQEYREIKKREIEARPKKLSGISAVTLICAVSLALVALLSDLLRSLTLFN